MEQLQAVIHEAKYNPIFTDKTKDISKMEQLCIVLWYEHMIIKAIFVKYLLDIHTHAPQLDATALPGYIWKSSLRWS